MHWRVGWYVLAVAILSPQYCCPEKAYAKFMSGTKYVTNNTWLTPDIVQEMFVLEKQLGDKDAAACFGFRKHIFKDMLKKYKESTGGRKDESSKGKTASGRKNANKRH